MRRNRYILSIFCLLLAIGSCSLAAENSSNQTASSLLTLDSCLSLAKKNNPAIRKASLEMERAEQVRYQALTKYFPQVQATAVGYHALQPLVDIGINDLSNASVRDLLLTLYGNYGAALGLESTFSLFQHGVTAGVTAIQPVFMGGKIIAANKLAQLGVEAAGLQSQIVERDLLEQVAESYWLVIGLQDKWRTLERATLLMDTLSHIVNTAVDAGLALETDRMQVEVKRAELSRQRIRIESGLRLAGRALAQSIGVDSLLISSNVCGLATNDVLYSNRSINSLTAEHQLLSLQTRAAELQRVMAVADALPRVAVGANYGYHKTDANILRNGLSGWNGAVFATVTVPLTGWWETGHKIKEQSLRLEQARLEERDLGEKLILRTEQAYDRMKESELLVAEAEHAVTLAAKRYRIVESSYKAGTATIAELLAAETDRLSAENELTDARIAYEVNSRRYVDLSF